MQNEKPTQSGGNTCERMVLVRKVYGFLMWAVWPLVGFFALVWFLIRVIPKPSRASYPCQRAAFPIASGFVIWITGLICSALALRKARVLFVKHKFVTAFVCMLVALIVGISAISDFRDG